MKNKFLKLTLTLFMVSTSLYATDIKDSVVATKHNKNLTIGKIAEIQPGLGTIMVEFGHRFYIAYYGAKASNWELAKYELHELIETQEIAEATRPEYKKQLKEFEEKHLEKLIQTIETKNFKKFEFEYTKTTKACNACHVANGHPYIQYELPKEAPKYLRMAL